MQPKIDLERVWWRYAEAEAWALRDLSLQVAPGEAVGIVGQAGAGKTTLCLALAGLIPQETEGEWRGRVQVCGLDTSTTPVRQLVQRVGLLLQNAESYLVGMSVLDELAFGLENLACPPDEMWRRIRWALDIMGLAGFEEKYPQALSGGQKQRVSLAAVLALQPEVLVLDSPFANVDGAGRTEVSATIRDLRARLGTTMVIVEHSTEDLAPLVDRMILLDQGRLPHQAAPRRFLQSVELLTRNSVCVPQVTELGYCLSSGWCVNGELPISVETAERWVRERVDDCQPSSLTADGGRIDAKPTAPASFAPVICAQGLRYVYPDGTVGLAHVDLEIHPGDYVALIGPNGSGKTTLAKHFIGLIKPTDGCVRVKGRDTRTTPIKELVAQVGYVFQNPDRQLCTETVEEEITFGLQNQGLPSGEIAERVERTLAQLGLARLQKDRICTLSLAERQCVAIASLLVTEPALLILDEPTCWLDGGQSRALMQLLDQVNERGQTIILITHNTRLVADHASRVVGLLEGRVMLDAPTRVALGCAAALNELLLSPPQVTRLAQRLAPLGFPPDLLTMDEMAKYIDGRVGSRGRRVA